MAAPMTVYAGRTAIGVLQDFGQGKILGRAINRRGHYVSLGFFQDRKTAREAVEAAAAGDIPDPPEAA